jgi:two-component system, NtrC family, nitrogen regulation sensor histidine kinase NtrY
MPFSRRITFLSSIILAIVALISALILQRAFPVLESEESFSSNIGFFLLINVNIVAVMILGFIVIRNIIRLVVDRRNNILGARLRSRLVFAFVMLSMVPTVLLFFVAQGMVEKVLQDWFSPKVESAFDSAKMVAHSYYDSLESDLNTKVNYIQDTIQKKIEKDVINNAIDEKVFLSSVINEIQLKYPSTYFILIDRELKLIPLGIGAINFSNSKLQIDMGKAKSAFNGVTFFQPEEFGGSEFIRAYAPLSLNSNSKQIDLVISYVLLLSDKVPDHISRSLENLLVAGDEYEEFKSYRRPLASSYFLTLVVVTLLVIFAAISVGFFLAKGLAVPIGLLAKGTEQVAHGNLSYKIPELGDDELGVLVRAFNKMTSDLKEATEELVSRSRYIETVLANVGVGVLSVDLDGILKTCNHSASQILEMDDTQPMLNRNYKQTLPKEFLEVINEMTTRGLRGKTRISSKRVLYPVGGRVKHLQIMLTKLFEESRQTELGLVILVDDVTEFERAQRMAAWQEVARRIAHEIKNPLTPIQLSAERIYRMKSRLASDALSLHESNLIDEATSVITTQVENLRVLVNEFSLFARMPKSELDYGDLNSVLEKSIESYRVSAPEITFTLDLESELPALLLDAFQMERVCTNLLDNAVASIREAGVKEPEIIISSRFDVISSLIVMEFKDNGIGVSDADKSKLFEPYFTKKKAGTGLGLAIVKTVISDHNGFIRIFDRYGGGLVVRIEMPVVR